MRLSFPEGPERREAAWTEDAALMQKKKKAKKTPLIS